MPPRCSSWSRIPGALPSPERCAGPSLNPVHCPEPPIRLNQYPAPARPDSAHPPLLHRSAMQGLEVNITLSTPSVCLKSSPSATPRHARRMGCGCTRWAWRRAPHGAAWGRVLPCMHSGRACIRLVWGAIWAILTGPVLAAGRARGNFEPGCPLVGPKGSLKVPHFRD